MLKNVVFMSAAMLFTAAAFAQYSAPRWEIYGDYSYMQYNPTLSGLQSRAFDGGGGGVQFNIGKAFGIKGDFQGYGSTQWTFTENTPVVTPHGLVPVGTYKSNGDMFTYMFGPVAGFHWRHLYLYGEYLLGGSNTNGYGQLVKSINAGGGSIVNVSGSQHPFTMALGGGVDWVLSKNFALRLGEMDWVLTRYTNPITQTNNQNNFRYLGGVVFTFGGQ